VNKFSRRLAFLSALFVTLFFVSGYLLSDASFFKRFIYRNDVNTPEAAFNFVIENMCVPDPRKPLPLEYSPRLMLTEQKNLYCDQSAILMATIIGEPRRDNRLVDSVGTAASVAIQFWRCNRTTGGRLTTRLTGG